MGRGNPMKRVILDTNIYGLLVLDKDRDIIVPHLERLKNVIMYGLPLIRKELRDTPKSIRIGNLNLRNYLLSLYDKITKERSLKITTEVDQLADSYFNVYRELGGTFRRNEIIKDFIIIAAGSVHRLDIVVSQDNKTMLSEKAIKSYKIVNQLRNIKIPRFLNYEEFKKDIR